MAQIKPKKIKHKTKIAVTEDGHIQAECICTWVGTTFTQENLSESISAAAVENAAHYTPKAKVKKNAGK